MLLNGRDCDALWLSKNGTAIKSHHIYRRIVRATERAFGVSIHPHLFRDCAATSVAVEDPEHVGIAAPILGHTTLRTTEQHYIQANMLAAGRRLRKSVDMLRKELKPYGYRRRISRGESP